MNASLMLAVLALKLHARAASNRMQKAARIWILCLFILSSLDIR
jgi:hypothetical protein